MYTNTITFLLSEIEIYEFCSLYNLINLVHDPTCYKNYINPTCIDLMLTNRMTYFQNTRTIETGLSDFHKMTVTVMKTSFKEHPAKVISYRDYRDIIEIIKAFLTLYSTRNLNICSLKEIFIVHLMITSLI